MPATPTVSRWPFRTTVRPVPPGTATRLGRSAGPTTVVPKPAASSRTRRCSTIDGSPAAPGTSAGLTLSMPTRSASRSTAAVSTPMTGRPLASREREGGLDDRRGVDAVQRVGVVDAAGLSELGHTEAPDPVAAGTGEERQRVRMTVLDGDQRRRCVCGEEVGEDAAAALVR